jgi:hypothetical protein
MFNKYGHEDHCSLMHPLAECICDCKAKELTMCEVTVTLNPVISINVNLAEAEYLQALLQNAYMYPPEENQAFSSEPVKEGEMRGKLYTALKKAIYPLKPTELR